MSVNLEKIADTLCNHGVKYCRITNFDKKEELLQGIISTAIRFAVDLKLSESEKNEIKLKLPKIAKRKAKSLRKIVDLNSQIAEKSYKLSRLEFFVTLPSLKPLSKKRQAKRDKEVKKYMEETRIEAGFESKEAVNMEIEKVNEQVKVLISERDEISQSLAVN